MICNCLTQLGCCFICSAAVCYSWLNLACGYALVCVFGLRFVVWIMCVICVVDGIGSGVC